jgi:hypothetical protein
MFKFAFERILRLEGIQRLDNYLGRKISLMAEILIYLRLSEDMTS